MFILSSLLTLFPVDGLGINPQLSTGKGHLKELSPFAGLKCANMHTWFVVTQVLEQTRENTVLHKKTASLLLPTTLY